MHSTIATLGPFTVHGYGLMIGLGVVAALSIIWKRTERRGRAQDEATILALLVIVLGFIGAKLLYILTNLPEFFADPLSILGSEGFVVYGGILLGIATLVIRCRIKRDDPLFWSDLMLPAVSLAQAFGRVGCFLAGCCYGKETTSALGVIFPEGCAAPAGVRLWPVQLFSAFGDLLIFALLLLAERKYPKRGFVTALYLVLYGVGRFLIEFFRNDPRGAVGIFSTSQFISLFVTAAGIAALIAVRKNAKKSAEKTI